MAEPMKIDTTLDWADGTYTFALRWADLVRLEGDADCGAFPLLMRLRQGGAVKDVADVIRNALIGGGLDSQKALQLVRSYVEGLPPGVSRQLAIGLLTIGLYGPLDTPAEPLPESANGD